MAQKLRDMGFTEAYALQGGWNAWQGSGYPVDCKTREEWTPPEARGGQPGVSPDVGQHVV